MLAMVAAFPWYDLPSVQWANDELWKATGLPGEYVRGVSIESLWHHEHLLVTQACGLDLFLTDAPIEPVAVPVFDLDCEPGNYYSVIIGDPDGPVAAVNGLTSRSGYSALLSYCSPNAIKISGSHFDSIKLIKAGLADVASIDAVTWSILQRDSPEILNGLTIVDRTTPALAPPFVSRDEHQEVVLEGLFKALSETRGREACRALLINDMLGVSRNNYAAIHDEYASLRGKMSLLTELSVQT